MKYILFFLCLLSVVISPDKVKAQLPVTTMETASYQQALLESKDPQLRAHKKLVFDFWREVFQARNMERAHLYMAEDYIQHNPNVPTGRKAFTDFFGQFKPQPVKPTIDNLVTIVAERELVILAFKRELEDPENKGQTYTTTWFDMFRIEDGKIAEHWDYGTK